MAKIVEEWYKCNFTAIQCNRPVNEFMRVIDQTLRGVGEKVEISFVTTTKPTREYIARVIKVLESVPDDKTYFAGVEFVGMELLLNRCGTGRMMWDEL